MPEEAPVNNMAPVASKPKGRAPTQVQPASIYFHQLTHSIFSCCPSLLGHFIKKICLCNWRLLNPFSGGLSYKTQYLVSKQHQKPLDRPPESSLLQILQVRSESQFKSTQHSGGTQIMAQPSHHRKPAFLINSQHQLMHLGMPSLNLS